jgi:hypothetical protein
MSSYRLQEISNYFYVNKEEHKRRKREDKIKTEGGGVAQALECLASKCEA